MALTRPNGTVAKSDLYEAFGNIVASTGSSSNNRLANTKERSFTLGLDNHGFRYFDPEIGRYISRDPIGYGDGLNVYLYVHNNPINHIDPLGLSKDDEDPYVYERDKEGRIINPFPQTQIVNNTPQVKVWEDAKATWRDADEREQWYLFNQDPEGKWSKANWEERRQRAWQMVAKEIAPLHKPVETAAIISGSIPAAFVGGAALSGASAMYYRLLATSTEIMHPIYTSPTYGEAIAWVSSSVVFPLTKDTGVKPGWFFPTVEMIGRGMWSLSERVASFFETKEQASNRSATGKPYQQNETDPSDNSQ